MRRAPVRLGLLIALGALASGCIDHDGLHMARTFDPPLPVPGFRASQHRSLSAVDAVSATDVWAVGGVGMDVYGFPDLKPLIEHWDGHAWSRVPLPATGLSGGLAGAAAPSPRETWAVGAIRGEPFTQPRAVILHRIAGAWQALDVPVNPGEATRLTAVAAVSPSEVWAVGSVTSSTGPWTASPYVVRYDGHTVHRVTVAGLVPTMGGLTSLSVAGPAAVFVGSGGAGYSPVKPGRVARWTGSAWQLLPPVPSSPERVVGLAAVSQAEVWATGHRAQVWHFRAGHWATETPDPRPGAQVDAVDAHDPGHVWVAGQPGVGPGAEKDTQMIARRDGVRWSVRFSLPLGGGLDGIYGPGFAALRARAGHVFAVGGFEKTLAVQN